MTPMVASMKTFERSIKKMNEQQKKRDPTFLGNLVKKAYKSKLFFRVDEKWGH